MQTLIETKCGPDYEGSWFPSEILVLWDTLIYNPDSTTETRVIGKDGRDIKKDLKTFLREDVSDSLHEMIRINVITATRSFHHRVESFKKEIMLGTNSPMRVKYISYRVEFQGRGAAHIHGTLLVDIKEIERSPIFQDEQN